MTKQVDQKEMIDKVRAAIKDRATWFALLVRSFKEAFPEKDVERLARKAIFEFGRMKARNDPRTSARRPGSNDMYRKGPRWCSTPTSRSTPRGPCSA